MDNEDVERYVGYLVEHAKTVSQTDPALHSRVVEFFRLNQPGERRISGMGQFELYMAYARIADLKAVAKNPNVRRIEVEDVFYATLAKNGMYLREHLKQSNFKPWGKTWPPTTMAEAQESLVRTKTWVLRPVERQPFSVVGTTPMASTDRTLAIAADAITRLNPDEAKRLKEEQERKDAQVQEETERQNKALMQTIACSDPISYKTSACTK